MNGIDATIIVAYLLVMVGVGVWFMRRNRSADDYFRGGGRLPWWVVSLSIYATLFSSITFLSIPALTYHSDCRYFFKTFGILLLVPVVVRFYLPFFRRLNLTSAYEYLEVRFNLGCRLFASAAFILFMIARTAVVAYLPAVAIAAVTGMDVNLAIVAVTAVTILYCTMGGVEAVVWSDFVQSVILIGSTVAIYAYLVCGTDGGFAGFLSKGLAAGKFKMMDFGWDWAQPVLWVAVVGGLVENLASYTSDQCVVQRYMTCRDEAAAAKSIRLNGVLSFVNCFVFFTLGVALWTFYQSHADRMPALAKNDQIFPWFIANELPVGFSGLVLAAVAAATMSTLSANLNSAATAFTTDFYRRLVAPRCDRAHAESRALLVGKVSTVVVGLLGGAFALVLANMDIGSVYDQFLKFLGVLTGGLACLFLMGRFLPFVNGRGAFAGLVANYVVCFALDLVPFAHKPHLLLYGFFGIVACLVVAPLASALLPEGRHPAKRMILCLLGLCCALGGTASPTAAASPLALPADFPSDGEVWLCAGQSNMEWPLRKAARAEAEARRLDEARIWHWDFRDDRWRRLTAANAADASALAVSFATRRAAETGKAVALVQVAAGGAPTESFLSSETMADYPRLARIAANPNALDRNDDFPCLWCKAEYPARRANEREGRWWAVGAMHRAGIARVKGLPLAGILWYQGESNATTSPDTALPDEYLLETLRAAVEDLRGARTIPFVMFGLPYIANRPWAPYRAAQRKVCAETGAIYLDTLAAGLGEAHDVHPRDKVPFAELALKAVGRYTSTEKKGTRP